MKLRNLFIWLASFLILGSAYAILQPNIASRWSAITSIDPTTYNLAVQAGTTQSHITAENFANSISWYFGTLTWYTETDPVWLANSGSYVPRANIDTGFNNTWSDTIIVSEAGIYNYLTDLSNDLWDVITTGCYYISWSTWGRLCLSGWLMSLQYLSGMDYIEQTESDPIWVAAAIGMGSPYLPYWNWTAFADSLMSYSWWVMRVNWANIWGITWLVLDVSWAVYVSHWTTMAGWFSLGLALISWNAEVWMYGGWRWADSVGAYWITDIWYGWYFAANWTGTALYARSTNGLGAYIHGWLDAMLVEWDSMFSGQVTTNDWFYLTGGTIPRRFVLSWDNLSVQAYTGWAWVERDTFTP